MPTNLKVESNHETLVYQIVMKLRLFGVKLGREDIKKIYEMSDDELANVAVDVGLENHSGTNPLAAKLGSLGAPTRNDILFVLLLNSSSSSSADSSQRLLGDSSLQSDSSSSVTPQSDGT